MVGRDVAAPNPPSPDCTHDCEHVDALADRAGIAVSALDMQSRAPVQRRGFCPTLWTPMESGDGLIVRLPAGSRGFAAGELRALCRLAEAHGNGLIEITRRANVQLRGIRAEALSELQRELVELGLASAADRRPASVLVNPLAGLAEAPAPLLPIGRAIEVALAGSDVLDRLSDKFGVIVDCRAELREI